MNGHAAPRIDQPFTYCDLGCGNGVSVNLLAAAFPQAHFYGVDFNAEHINNARNLATQSKLENVTFIEASFEEFAKSDPPGFDFIAMHGIYSWVSADIREQIRQLVAATLKPRGLVYFCYNSFPGWSELMPLWKMMQSYTQHIDANSLTRARAGLDQLRFLQDSNSAYFDETPSARSHLKRLLNRNINFVAHEFCNEFFEPQYFCDVAQQFGTIGAEYAGTMKLHRNRLENRVQERFFEHVREAKTAVEQETRTSFIRNEFFRRDLFRRPTSDDNQESAQSDIFDFVIGGLRSDEFPEATLEIGHRSARAHTPLMIKLYELAQPGNLTGHELINHAELRQFGADKIKIAIQDLLESYMLHPFSKPAVDVRWQNDDCFKIVDAVNRNFIEMKIFDEGKTYVISQVLGSAIRLSFINGLILWKLDGQSFHAAKQDVLDHLSQLSEAERSRLKIPDQSRLENWLDRKIKRFKNTYLSDLLRLAVVEIQNGN